MKAFWKINRCPHTEILGVYEHQVSRPRGYHLQCVACWRYLDGPLLLATHGIDAFGTYLLHGPVQELSDASRTETSDLEERVREAEEARDRWKDRWAATVKDADAQRARVNELENAAAKRLRSFHVGRRKTATPTRWNVRA